MSLGSVNALRLCAEINRFQWPKRSKSVLRSVITQLGIMGLAELRVDFRCNAIAGICESERSFISANHAKEELNYLAANGAVIIRPDGDALIVSVTPPDLWNCAKSVEAAFWLKRLNALRQLNGLAQLQFAPGHFHWNEPTLAESAAREQFQPDSNAPSDLAQNSSYSQFSHYGKPISHNGKSTSSADDRLQHSKHSMFMRPSCANTNFDSEASSSRARARELLNRTVQQNTFQQLNSTKCLDESSRLLRAIKFQFERAHGAKWSSDCMANFGGMMRIVARHWPTEFETQVGELRNFIDGSGKFTRDAWAYFQYYFSRAVGHDDWQHAHAAAKKLKESL